uniref:Poly [ADP-ribose] polymerase n=2 Tax=Cacopsylla melanoneura TaxID=428564 RepID=A0A8D9A1V6_9HEMI
MPEAENNIKGMLPKEKDLQESVDNVTRNNGEVAQSSLSSPQTSTINTKIIELKQSLAKSKLGCDIKWSIFVSACHSYRVSSCLHPFPTMFIKDGLKDISAVLDCIDQMPLLSSVLHKHITHSSPPPPTKLHPLIYLLHWLLVEQSPSLNEVPRTSYDSVLNLVSSQSTRSTAKPDLIFQVQYSPHSSIEMNWSKMNHLKTFHAFHGSRLENFHSIMHFGLQQHFNKNSLFGQGIYLSSELGICLMYSPYSVGWGGSCIGSELSVVALCSIVDDPDQVKCQEDTGENKGRALAKDSLGGEVPHKYYVVQNSVLVKVEYLLVYTRHKVTPSQHVIRPNCRSMLLHWILRNKFICFIIGYGFLLFFIGLSGNVTFQRYFRYCTNKLYEMLGVHIQNTF